MTKCAELGSQFGDSVFTGVAVSYAAPDPLPDQPEDHEERVLRAWAHLKAHATFAFFLGGWWGGPPARLCVPLGWLANGPEPVRPMPVEIAVGERDVIMGFINLDQHVPMGHLPLMVTVTFNIAR